MTHYFALLEGEEGINAAFVSKAWFDAHGSIESRAIAHEVPGLGDGWDEVAESCFVYEGPDGIDQVRAKLVAAGNVENPAIVEY